MFENLEISDKPEYIFNGVKMTEDEYKYYIRQNELIEELIPWTKVSQGWVASFYDQNGDEFLFFRSFTTKEIREGQTPFRLH